MFCNWRINFFEQILTPIRFWLNVLKIIQTESKVYLENQTCIEKAESKIGDWL